MRIAVLIDLSPTARYRTATLDAIAHAASGLALEVEPLVLPTDSASLADEVAASDGVVIGPGSPYRDERAVWDVVRSARERGVPLVGTWGGFQHVLVEHARTLLGIDDASHAESSTAGTPIVTPLSCSLDGRSIEVALTEGSMLRALHGDASSVTELTTCSYGLDPAHQHVASTGGMRISGIDDTGEVRAIERPDHPFFVGTLYQPQLRSTPEAPHPVWLGFVEACHRARSR